MIVEISDEIKRKTLVKLKQATASQLKLGDEIA
jgi:hypothetical protein